MKMRSAVIITIVVLCFAVDVFAASKIKEVKEGNVLFQEGQFEKSLEKFQAALKEDPESDVINYGLGTVYYKNEDYHKAIDHLQKALLSENVDLQAQAHYNLGNSFYRIGKDIQMDNIELAIRSLKESLKHYERTLITNDKDEDAQYNYDFVKKELEKLQEQQKQQQQQNQKNQQDQSQDQNQPQSQQNNNQDKQQDDQPENQQSPQKDNDHENQDNQSGGNDSWEQKPPQTNEQQNQEQPNESEISKREAEMMLNDYQQNEEPQRLLNFTKQQTELPVVKDW